VNNKRRYHYYVSRVTIEKPGTKLQKPTRWPAKELETVVLDRVQSFLLSEAEVFGEYHGDTGEGTQELVSAAKDLASRWPRLSPGEISEFVSSCVDRVIVNQNTVEVLLDKAALAQHLLGAAAGKIDINPTQTTSRAVICLRADAKLQRCGGEVCLLVPALGGESKVRPRPVPSLIKAIARAHAWYERLLQGDVGNCTALATETGLGDRYVSRVLRFAFLAPDIVESILDGTQPPDLTFAKMAQDIPMSWAEQRDRFGFPPVPTPTFLSSRI